MSSSYSWLVIAGIAPILFALFWTLSSTSGSPFTSSLPKLYNKRICLLIAHPDDEAMFFAPTLLALTRPELGNHVKILCLSTGDADGLGQTRTKELQKSAVHLGLRNESDVFVVDDPSRFPDSMTATWTSSDISSLLASAFAPDLSTASPSSGPVTRRSQNGKADGPPNATIDVLLTFDERGISNHPNHRSLYHGAVAFLKGLMKGKSGYSCPVALYTLTSTNVLRKYVGVLDSPMTMFLGALNGLRDSATAKAAAKDRDLANRLLFVSSLNQWSKARIAMTDGHKSQMLWFRWGWITIGRYMVVNDLKRENV